MSRDTIYAHLRRVLCGTLFAWSVAFACAAEQPPIAGPIPITYFGMHFHRLTHTTPWPSAPIGAWRLHDAEVTWADLERERGKWDFSVLDRYVGLAASNGVGLLLPLGFSPKWAAARPDEHGPYGPGSASEPARIEDWRNYVRTVATRYKGRITQYELWNEVNVPEFFSGSMADLVLLAREAHGILKSIDPANTVVSPSIVGEARYPFLDEYLVQGARYADVIGFHFYMPYAPPETMLKEIREVRKIMVKHGIASKPLWNTETGWWISNTDGSEDPPSMDPDWIKLEPKQGAEFLARALILSWAAGVQRFYWYSWDHLGMGLMEPKSKALKPAAVAYATVVRWLRGASIDACEANQGIWTCRIRSPQGEPQNISWRAADANSAGFIRAGDSFTSYETLLGAGKQRKIDATRRIPVNAGPILIR